MPNRLKEKVSRIATRRDGCYIRLKNIPDAEQPKDNYFVLKLDHPNYNALYSLVILAATNNYDLRIRATEDFDPSREAVVSWMEIDW